MTTEAKYEKDIGDGMRKTRCRNIATALIYAYEELPDDDRKNGDRFVTKRNLRKFILSQNKEKPKDEEGDMRAHGDCCGLHGLCLDMVGSGGDAKIHLNEDNINKCKNYLDNTNPREFTFQ